MTCGLCRLPRIEAFTTDPAFCTCTAELFKLMAEYAGTTLTPVTPDMGGRRIMVTYVCPCCGQVGLARYDVLEREIYLVEMAGDCVCNWNEEDDACVDNQIVDKALAEFRRVGVAA